MKVGYDDTFYKINAKSTKEFFHQLLKDRKRKNMRRPGKVGIPLYCTLKYSSRKELCWVYKNSHPDEIQVCSGLKKKQGLEFSKHLRKLHGLNQLVVVNSPKIQGLNALLSSTEVLKSLKITKGNHGYEYLRSCTSLKIVQLINIKTSNSSALPNFYKLSNLSFLNLKNVKYESKFNRYRFFLGFRYLKKLEKLVIEDNYENNTSNHLNINFVTKKTAQRAHPFLIFCHSMPSAAGCDVFCSRGALKNKQQAIYWLNLIRSMQCFKSIKLTHRFPFLTFKLGEYVDSSFDTNFASSEVYNEFLYLEG